MRAALKAARIGGQVARSFQAALQHVGFDLVDEPAQQRLLALLLLEPLERVGQVNLRYSNLQLTWGADTKMFEFAERECLKRLSVDMLGEIPVTPVTVRRQYNPNLDGNRVIATVATLPQDVVRAPRGASR